ncbi:hypothetical protein BDV06DRAFT_111864 [Aspergillus oleicola]
MSFGWSAGDLVLGANIAWTIYESFGTGARSARSEFTAFRTEFGLIKTTLKRLGEVAANCPGEDLDLGKGYQETLERCAGFIDKHKALTKEVNDRRPSFHERIVGVFDRVAWPLERREAGQLRESLEKYVQIAMFKVTANTSDATRRLTLASEQARIDHLELLRAVKTMSVQVSALLRRCVPDDMTDDPSLDMKYLARLQRRHLSSLLDPLPGLNAIPEEDIISQTNSQAALQRIQEITDRLGHLALRLDTIRRQPTPSPERPGPPKRTDTNDTIGSDTTIVAPVMDLLTQIGDEVREALDRVGYDHFAVPGQGPSDLHHHTDKSAKMLNNAAEDWDQFKDWLQFQLLHPFEIHPGHDDISPRPTTSTWRPPSTESDLLLPPFATSPPNDLEVSGALSPLQISRSHETPVEMSRTSSTESYQPRSPSSASSVWERRSSAQSLPLSQHPVQIFFPDRHRVNRFIHPSVTCHAVVYFHPQTNEPELIEGTDLQTGVKVSHSFSRKQSSSKVETSMIPYIPHSRYSSSPSKSPFCIRFMGSHRVSFEQDGHDKERHCSPVYICHDKEDYNLMQTNLLRRRVIFCGNVNRIHSKGTGDHCSQETVRVLKDPLTGTTSILYFASKRKASGALPGFVDYSTTEFSAPKKAGRQDVQLPLPRTRKDSLSFIHRRNSVESSLTTLSGESHTSRGSAFSSVGSDLGRTGGRWLQFDFETARDSDAFIAALQHPP